MNQDIKQGRTVHYLIIAGWALMALAIILIAPLLISEESRSSYFWYRVIWSEVLCLLFWGGTAFYILVSAAQKDSETRFGGISPTISIVVAAYSVLSILAMTAHAFIYKGDTASRAHWILQIILFTIAALCIVFLFISRTAATSGLSFDKTKALTPKELHDLLAVYESLVRNGAGGPVFKNLKASMKQLRETLLYSLNESASLAETVEYQTLSNEIKKFCDSVGEFQRTNKDDVVRCNELNESVGLLVAKIKQISTKQIRS